MNLSCIIVDDEPLAVRLLESFVAKTPGLTLMASFTDPVEAVNAVKENRPDLLFLDIQMPDINGMELAHVIPEETRVIFTTAFKEYAFESYEVSALDFLLKPIRYNKFVAAVEKARMWFERTHETIVENSRDYETGNEETIFLKVDGEYQQVSLSNVLYVSGMKDYVMFYLDDKRQLAVEQGKASRPLVTHLTMKAVEEMLPQDKFMRVNRSYIVALDKIRKVDRNDCIYIGGEIIHVTDAYLDKFLEYLKSRCPGC